MQTSMGLVYESVYHNFAKICACACKQPPQELPEFSSEAVKHIEDERILAVVVSWNEGGSVRRAHDILNSIPHRSARVGLKTRAEMQEILGRKR